MCCRWLQLTSIKPKARQTCRAATICSPYCLNGLPDDKMATIPSRVRSVAKPSGRESRLSAEGRGVHCRMIFVRSRGGRSLEVGQGIVGAVLDPRLAQVKHAVSTIVEET
jgi:hypothetical protein